MDGRQYQQEIPTISRVAPPSYAEAMAHTAIPKTNGPNPPHAPRLEDLEYDYRLQAPPYVPVAMPSGDYPSTASPAQRDGIYPTNPQQQQQQQQQSQTSPQCVMRVERVVYKTRWKDRCCSPKVSAGIFTFFLVLLLIKVFVAHAT